MSCKPLNYYLHYDVDLEERTFSGKEVIKLQILNPVKEIRLDSIGLEVQECHFESVDLKIAAFQVDEQEGAFVVHLEEELDNGEYDLFIRFTGKLTDSLAGFYTSKYEVDGVEKVFATTQFEAADARRAFPCFDAPEHKATFDVSFSVASNLSVVSNTLPFDVIEFGEKKTYYFERTPKMSTYLLYFGVGEFEFLEDRYKNIRLRVVTTPGKRDYGKPALEFAKKFLQYFEEYFDYPYILPKLDLIAVPDFGAGAMENWGAITFRENMLLVYPGKTSQATIVRIAEYIAHELAHQWFGNLVTMKWWDNLWLNESFATFMAFKAINYFYPEWDVWSDYLISEVFGGMDLDSLSSSHPIKMPVKSIADIDEAFDAIAYNKGGSVLRMLERYIGDDNFRDGLRRYIRTYEYANTIETDLWKELETASDKPVVTVMKTFVEQIGFPVVRCTLHSKELHLEQRRFLLSGVQDDESMWSIPMVIQKDDKEERLLFDSRKAHLPAGEFVMLNKEYTGFYITDYPNEIRSVFTEQWSSLGNKERLGIIHDLNMLTFSTSLPLADFIAFCSAVGHEESDTVVLEYLLSRLYQIWLLMPKHEDLLKLVSELAKTSLAITGMEPEQEELPSAEILRSLAIKILFKLDDADIQKFVLDAFERFNTDEASLAAGIRAVIFAGSVWFNDGIHQKMKERYATTDSLDDKIKILRALCYVRNDSLIHDTLVLCLDGTIRFSNLPYILAAMADNEHAQRILLDWLMDNWDELKNQGGGMGGMILQRAFQYCIPSCGVGRREEIKAYFAQKDLTGQEKTFAQSLEELEINERFVEVNRQ
jgi:tricorn protease interacting factor F2/3